MGKYIDLGDLTDQLSTQIVDAGQSFLAGKLTNVFNDIGRDPDSHLLTGGPLTADEADSGGGAGGGAEAGGAAGFLASILGIGTSVATAGANIAAAASSVANGLNIAKQAVMDVGTLTEALVEKGAQAIAENAARIAGDYVNNHTKAMAKLPATIQSYAMAYFNAYKLSLSDLLKDQVENVEDKIQKVADAADELAKNDFLKKAKEQVTKVTGKASEMAAQIPTYVNMITTYILQGPQWIESKMDEFIGSKTEEIEKMVNKQWELDKKAYDEFAQKQGDKIGAKLVGRFNEELRKQAKKIENLKKKVEEKLKIETNKILQKAKLVIMAKLGINLPI